MKTANTSDMTKEYKIGDLVVLRNVRPGTGLDFLVGKILKVTTRAKDYIYVQCNDNPAGGSWTLYWNDEVCLADRKEQAKYLRQKVIKMSAEIKEMQTEILHLERFETEEDYVAFKLDNIIKASKTGGAKQIAEMLKVMKESNML